MLSFTGAGGVSRSWRTKSMWLLACHFGDFPMGMLNMHQYYMTFYQTLHSILLILNDDDDDDDDECVSCAWSITFTRFDEYMQASHNSRLASSVANKLSREHAAINGARNHSTNEKYTLEIYITFPIPTTN